MESPITRTFPFGRICIFCSSWIESRFIKRERIPKYNWRAAWRPPCNVSVSVHFTRDQSYQKSVQSKLRPTEDGPKDYSLSIGWTVRIVLHGLGLRVPDNLSRPWIAKSDETAISTRIDAGRILRPSSLFNSRSFSKSLIAWTWNLSNWSVSIFVKILPSAASQVNLKR